MHAKDTNGKATFITPLVTKGLGKDAVNVNVKAGGQFALDLSYIVIAGSESSDRDNKYNNSVVRKASADVITALKAGKPEDVFTFHMPKQYDDRDNYQDVTKWTPILKATRGDILKIAEAVVKVDSIMREAEAESARIALTVKPVIESINARPVYFTGDNTGRGKRKAGVIEI